ncbi:MAG TPA: amidohydrolase family protein, partial [Xanthomonadales bacterium]|nr:amidohydrolase family protein [Xanthomonadales bacterium]
DAGVPLAFGSDFPVESVDPRLGLRAAITRQDAEGKPAHGWFASERVTAYEALRGFTADAAWAGFAETEVGMLRPGLRADFVVLDADPLEQRPAGIAVLDVYVDGVRAARPGG